MSIDDMIEVLTAFKGGKQIEYRSRLVDENFVDSNAPTWNFGTTEYRIKPQPIRIPFAWNDRDSLRGKWVKWIFEDKEFTVNCICERGLCFSGELFTWDRLFKDLEFIDGTPFGKLKQ